jgi:hypothetical protein
LPALGQERQFCRAWLAAPSLARKPSMLPLHFGAFALIRAEHGGLFGW